jgi:hypothetical protein
MGQRLDRFFADSPKPLRLGFMGFVVAGLGVAVGFIAIGWSWYSVFRRNR